MSEPIAFLNAFAHALSVMTLYPEGHPSRESAIDATYEQLSDLTSGGQRPSFTFLDDEVIYGREALRDLKGWPWGRRLTAAGISLPVIYITGNDNPAVRTAALASGCIAYLTKPFAAKSLLEPVYKASASMA